MSELIHSAAPRQADRRTLPHRIPWMNHEEKKLRQLYPKASKAEICEEFSERTWASIRRRAEFLRIRRLETVPRNENLHPVVSTLIDRRVALGLKRADTARLIGWNPKWHGALERGTRLPTLPMLDQWAAALGLQIAAVAAKPCATESATNQE